MTQNELTNLGYAYLDVGTDLNLLNEISHLSGTRLNLTRSVTISSLIGEGDLQSSNDEFYYHTDATFQLIPPKYIAIQLLKPCEGGEIRVFNSSHLNSKNLEMPCYFGSGDQRILARILDRAPDGSFLFRYRRDFMSPALEESDLERVHQELFLSAQSNSISLGAIPLGKVLVINNWRFLHSRGSFSGERTIRRYWFHS